MYVDIHVYTVCCVSMHVYIRCYMLTMTHSLPLSPLTHTHTHIHNQHSNLPRVVIVRGLPTTYPQARISQRLDRLSDNCGGKVLKVDVRAGTAKILFRTPEWANK